jgi:hypothetical protein
VFRVELADTLSSDLCWGSPFPLLETGFQPIGPSSDFSECVFVYIDSCCGKDPLDRRLRGEAIFKIFATEVKGIPYAKLHISKNSQKSTGF